MKKNIVLFFAILFTVVSFAQDVSVYPTHWWTGMKSTQLQLMIRKVGIGNPANKSVTINYPGVKLLSIQRVENPNYLFINVSIQPSTKPGKFPVKVIANGKTTYEFTYELKSKSKQNGTTRVRGITSTDFSYLLMPDRFANGNPANDALPDLYRDKTADRNNKFARHGGDLKGVQDHLDYFNELGITAIWFTPVTENDMPKMREGSFDMAGYHGYWFTDHYNVDKRFGTNDEYKTFINAAHQKGLKVIQDAIYNHIGLEHWINRDPPAKDWINQWPEFTGPNHREETMFDPYASKFDKNNMVKGWFVKHLPDLNLANPLLATYLIQHAIWSVEEFGFDGFRIDTYKYCDETFVNNVNAALKSEFPTITTFVEAWANTVVANAYFVDNNFKIPFKHNAPGAIDFSLCFAMQAGMNQPFGWTEGVNRIYMTLAQDIVYKNPLNNCIFLDNHDMDRVFSVIGEDWSKMKWGLNWLLTMRGIPQLYYGTEILMKNFKNPTDAEVRLDFPGGWAGDSVNKFTREGRSTKENEAFDHISKLAIFRKTSSALTTGKTMQFIVRDGVYIYFRYDDRQTIMIITNTSDRAYKPDWTIYQERIGAFKNARNIHSNKTIALEGMEIPGKESWVMELK
ncbi:MAG: cyclomaltodextrinase N-terminal domain-containing protein [Chitinophagaceae bacterium]|nr:cyclomaltodextrinase N-terminal domain-containing protein [Chitinophagaceae bacterium]